QTPASEQLANAAAARAVLAAAYTTAPLDGLPAAQHAAGMVLGYLRTLKGETATAGDTLHAHTVAGSQARRLDHATRRHLEATATSRERASQGTLLWAIDRTASAMGRRLLRSWLARPLVELRPIRARQRIIAALLEAADHRQAIAQTV